ATVPASAACCCAPPRLFIDRMNEAIEQRTRRDIAYKLSRRGPTRTKAEIGREPRERPYDDGMSSSTLPNSPSTGPPTQRGHAPHAHNTGLRTSREPQITVADHKSPEH